MCPDIRATETVQTCTCMQRKSSDGDQTWHLTYETLSLNHRTSLHAITRKEKLKVLSKPGSLRFGMSQGSVHTYCTHNVHDGPQQSSLHSPCDFSVHWLLIGLKCIVVIVFIFILFDPTLFPGLFKSPLLNGSTCFRVLCSCWRLHPRFLREPWFHARSRWRVIFRYWTLFNDFIVFTRLDSQPTFAVIGRDNMLSVDSYRTVFTPQTSEYTHLCEQAAWLPMSCCWTT